MLFCLIFIFIIIIIVVVIISFIIIIYCFIAHVWYFGAIVIYFSCVCILFGCSTLCWTMIQSCDYDWISIFHVMNCMYSIWVLWNLLQSAQKPVAVTLLVWRLVAWGVLPGNLGCVAR